MLIHKEKLKKQPSTKEWKQLYRITSNSKSKMDNNEQKKPEKCISIKQPWASLIICGVKKQESRNWATKHTGRLWIAACKPELKKEDLHNMEATYKSITYNIYFLHRLLTDIIFR